MKLYIEAMEIIESEAMEEEPDFIRLEIEDDLTEEKAIELIKSLMTPPYIIRRHYCYHDEDPKKPCKTEILEEAR